MTADTDWGGLYAARTNGGTVFLSTGRGRVAARTVTGYGGELLGYVTARIESSGFAQAFDGVMAPADDLLVLDGTTGQNGLIQAKQFQEIAGVTGIVLTKLDGTAKGGCVVAVKQRLGLPVRFIGVGEGIDDLLPFTPEGFVEELLPREWKH